MTNDTREMMDSTGGTSSDELIAAIDALGACEKVSNMCAMAMVQGGGMAAEVHQALDCADVCESTQRVLSRGAAPVAQVTAAVVAAAIVVCEASAVACGAHCGHHVHCQLHSASARACVDALRSLEKALLA
jgi:hypothetical protein